MTASYLIPDERFSSGTWCNAGGNVQSVTFYQRALQEIRDSTYSGILDMLIRGRYALHDYGCAEGDGTALLHATFPMARIKGFDLQPSAIANAKARWPTVNFAVGDIMAPQEHANIIWASHTLEHLSDPAAAVRGLLSRCRWLVILVPPIGEKDESSAHGGAVGVNVWTSQIAQRPLLSRFFITERIHPDKSRHAVLLEETLFFIYQGHRDW